MEQIASVIGFYSLTIILCIIAIRIVHRIIDIYEKDNDDAR